MKLQPTINRATISLIPMSRQWGIPVVCFEYATTPVKVNEPFYYGSLVAVGKPRVSRLVARQIEKPAA